MTPNARQLHRRADLQPTDVPASLASNLSRARTATADELREQSWFAAAAALRADRQAAKASAGASPWRVHCFLLFVVAAIVPASMTIGGLSLDAVLYIVICAVGGALVLNSTLPARALSIIALYGVFLLIALVSLAWAADLTVGGRMLAQLTAPAIVFLLSWCLPDRERFLRAAALFASIGVLVGSALLLLSLHAPIPVAPRPLAISLIPLFVLATYATTSRVVVLLLAALALTAGVSTGARTASAVLILVIVSSPALRVRLGGRIALIAVSVVLVVLASHTAAFKQRFFYSKNSTASLSTVVLSGGRSSELNTSGRANVWPLIEHVCDAQPTLGFGIGADIRISLDVSAGAFSQPHNDYIRLRCDTGYVGSFPAWTFFGLALLRCGWWALFDRRSRGLQIGAIQLVGALLILASTDNPIVYVGMFMAPLALCLGLADAASGDAARSNLGTPHRRWALT
jgi:hypothetical protein